MVPFGLTKQNGYLYSTIGALIVVVICELIWPEVIPFTFFQFLAFKGTLSQVLTASWPILLWGACVTAFFALTSRNDRHVNRHAELILVEGGVISVMAGVLEEIAFRWWIFYGAIVGVKISNFLFFGFLGFGIPAWLYLNLFGPVANLATLGILEPILFNGLGWAVGAAVLSSNGKFRDGHMYKGPIGWINSWFIGMFMFYLMFQYGLLAAVLIHFLYDLFIYCIHYVDAAVERSLGWA